MDITQIKRLIYERQCSIVYRDAVLADLFYDGLVLKPDVCDEKSPVPLFESLLSDIDKGILREDCEYLVYNPLKKQVKKKSNYLLARPYTLKGNSDVSEFVTNLKELLTDTVVELYKKGEVWWEFVPDNESALKFKICLRKAQSIVPNYTNEEHTEYDAVGYLWNRILEDGKVVRYIDVVDKGGRHRVSLADLNVEELPHSVKNEKGHNFSLLPFVRLTGDGLYQLIVFLGKMYSTRYQQADSLVADNADPVGVVKNASGTDSESLSDEIKQFRLVKVQGDGDFSYASKSFDYSSIENFMKVLKSDMADLCGTVSREQELQYITSGRALDRLYVEMDSDAAEMGNILRKALKTFLSFVSKETGRDFIKGFDIVFNTDKPTDEQQIIANINSSKDLVSERTLLEQHPWVEDVDEELKRRKEEKKMEPDTSQEKDPTPPEEVGEEEEEV